MNFDACRKITQQNARSFYFASFPLPRAKRDATFATYAFCRTADDIVDEAAPGTEAVARRQLDELRAMLDGIEQGDTPAHELWGPLGFAIHSFTIPLAPLRALLDGIESDLVPRRFAHFDELETYCFSVASTVGIALAHIFGFESEDALEYAANMGIAMQLTNIIRDVGTDYDLGRVYLPLEDLERFGCSEQTIARRTITAPFRELLEFEIARARDYYRKAFMGIRHLTRDGSHWTALLMGDVYRAILNDVERGGYDVFRRRAGVPLSRKIARAMVAPLTFRRDVLQISARAVA